MSYISFNEIPQTCASYQEYTGRIQRRLKDDLRKEFPNVEVREDEAVWDILGEIYELENEPRFIFVLDEWDYIFHRNFVNFSYTDNVSPISNDRLITEAFGLNQDDINRSVSRNPNYKYEGSTITLPDINPNEVYSISDYVRVDNSDKTFTDMQFKVSSKDMESCYYNLDFYFIACVKRRKRSE